MPDVTSIGTQVPRSWGLSSEIRGSYAGIGLIGYEDVDSPRGCGGYKLIESNETTVAGGICAEHRSNWCTMSFGRRGCR